MEFRFCLRSPSQDLVDEDEQEPGEVEHAEVDEVAHLGFGRIVVSQTEASIMLVNLVQSG